MTKEHRGIFEEVKEFPDPSAARRFAALVGLDEVKERLVKEATVLLNPASLERWSKQHHAIKLKLINTFLSRTPLFLFGGDVGTGKTALAQTFGDAVARESDISVTLYSLSLTARGTGAVGEMTTLISAAFDEIRHAARKGHGKSGRAGAAVILLIDEADALAQSRELAHMHHEDRAGVNALIRGVDDLSGQSLPVLVVMCTNRLEAIDPAIRRRAATTFAFSRPNEAQRVAVLKGSLAEVGFTEPQILELARRSGEGHSRKHGYTYSDLTQRFLPTLVLDAFPNRPINYERALELLALVEPTPPFTSEG